MRSAAGAQAPRKRRKSTATLGDQTAAPVQTPTLDHVPAEQEYPQQVQAPVEIAEPEPATTGAGLTDQELMQRDLPPLRGPWIRIQRDAHPLSPRDEAEMQLRSIESGYSGWLGAEGRVNYRSGNLGYDELADLEAAFEASAPLGYNARIVFVVKPVFLDSGQANGNATLSVLGAVIDLRSADFDIHANAHRKPGPHRHLTSARAAEFSRDCRRVAVDLPAFCAGRRLDSLRLSGGSTFTGRAQWKPGNGPITFNFVRDPIKDSQLSYSGLRDPQYTTEGSEGPIWGGVVANSGNIQIAKGGAEAGIYMGAGGQYITGYNVENNFRFDASGGAYWRLKTVPEYGNLSIGANFFAMRYSHNEDAFTWGMGGYFSPQAYFLANIPFTWTGHYLTRWHYNIVGSLGVQAFSEDTTPLYPNVNSSVSFENGLENTTTLFAEWF
jgi:hypothetical protein